VPRCVTGGCHYFVRRNVHTCEYCRGKLKPWEDKMSDKEPDKSGKATVNVSKMFSDLAKVLLPAVPPGTKFDVRKFPGMVQDLRDEIRTLRKRIRKHERDIVRLRKSRNELIEKLEGKS